MVKSNDNLLINLTGSDIDYQDNIVIKTDGVIRFETKYIPTNVEIELNNNMLNLFRKEINHIDITLNHKIDFAECKDVLIIINPTEVNKFNILSKGEKVKTLEYICKSLNIPNIEQASIISPFNIVPRIIESFKSTTKSVIYCDSFEIIYNSPNKKFETETFTIKEIDKSEVSIHNSNNLIVIVSETGPNRSIELNKINKMVKTDV